MYFKNCTCLEDLKKLYRKLAMKNHPDIGGDTETMKKINAEYSIMFEKVKNIRKNAKGEQYEAKTATTEEASEFINIINQLINIAGVELEIIGSWLWCYGETYPIKELLKKLGFKWSTNKKAWAFHKEPYQKTSNKQLSLEDIRMLYGSAKINKNRMPEALEA